MAESRVRIGVQGALSPDDVASRTFAITRRGFDVAHVREYLAAVSSELRRMDERIKELEGELAAAGEPGDLPPVDVATLTAALGEETARVLRTAQEAAADLKTRAEEGAARTLNDAHEEAARIRAAAETVLAERTEEAEAAATKLRDEAEAEVQGLRQRVEAEVAAMSEAARAEADAAIHDAIERGREMVSEAQAARERMLTDLARRRKTTLIQVEQLRAGRDRLLEAYKAVRVSLDEITAELEHADFEARQAADAAARRTQAETPDTIAAEEVAEAAAVARAPEAAVVLPESMAEPLAAAGMAVGEHEAAARPEVALAPAAPEVALPPAAGARPAPPGGDKAPVATLPGSAVGEEGEEGAEAVAPAARGAPEGEVGELFARIKADRGDGGDRGDKGGRGRKAKESAAAGEVAEAVGVADVTLTPEVAEAAPEPAGEPAGSAGAAEGARSDADEGLLLQRDEAVDALAVALTRRLKRLLQDEQNMVLDRMRKHRGKLTSAALLPDADDHPVRYVEAAVSALTEAEQAGAVMAAAVGPADMSGPPDFDRISALASALAADLIEPLRQRLTRSMADAATDDPTTVTDVVGAAYRELKSRRIERIVGDQLTAALTLGIVRALPAGVPVRWVVDDVDGPCPDCDDNSLAGAWPLGEPFPTGQIGPPAHSGCRCLLGPPPA